MTISTLIVSAALLAASGQAADMESCDTGFTVIERGETACGIGLSAEGALLVGSTEAAGPVVVSYSNSGERDMADAVTIFPASPGGRYAFVMASNEDSPFMGSFIVDLQEATARAIYAGRYGPDMFIAWSPDGSNAALLHGSEGAEWLTVVDAETGETAEFPGGDHPNNVSFARSELVWASDSLITVPVQDCPLDGECSTDREAYTVRSLAFADGALRVHE